jgi:nitric oxide reductase activation protein
MKDVEYYCYGFTSDCSRDDGTPWGGSGRRSPSGTNNIYVYREPGGVNSKYALGTMSQKSNNRDGVVIRKVVERVRKQTSNPVLMFMVSDGSPAAHGYSDGEKDVKLAVQQVSKKNVEVVHIAIGELEPAARNMYPVVIDFTHVADLPKQIGLLMKKFVSKKIHATLTM